MTHMMPVAPRGDALRNRARIIEAARAVWIESADASLQSIAKRAGIGQGTLYRHFPNRASLVLAVHEPDIRALALAAPALLAEYPPTVALRRWLDTLARDAQHLPGLVEALLAVPRAQLAEEGYGPVIAAITLLIEVGTEAAQLRADLDAEEVLLLVSFLWRLHPDADRDSRSSHLLDVVVDGLRLVDGPPGIPD